MSDDVHVNVWCLLHHGLNPHVSHVHCQRTTIKHIPNQLVVLCVTLVNAINSDRNWNDVGKRTWKIFLLNGERQDWELQFYRHEVVLLETWLEMVPCECRKTLSPNYQLLKIKISQKWTPPLYPYKLVNGMN